MRTDVEYVGLYILLRGCDEITPTGYSSGRFHQVTYLKKEREYCVWCHANEDGSWRFAYPEETRILNKNVI